MKKQVLINKLEALKNHGEYENALMKRYLLMKSISELSLDKQLKLLGLKLSVGVIEDINIANNNFVIKGENRDVYWLITKDVDVILNHIINNFLD